MSDNVPRGKWTWEMDAEDSGILPTPHFTVDSLVNFTFTVIHDLLEEAGFDPENPSDDNISVAIDDVHMELTDLLNALEMSVNPTELLGPTTIQ